jgi:hypothetical protein
MRLATVEIFENSEWIKKEIDLEAPIYDKIGQEITPGSIIVYGHALGRCAALKIGKVFAVARKVGEWNKRLEYRITVVGVEENSWKSSEKLSIQTRKGTLQFPDRCIVLSKDMVSEEFLNVLNRIEA